MKLTIITLCTLFLTQISFAGSSSKKRASSLMISPNKTYTIDVSKKNVDGYLIVNAKSAKAFYIEKAGFLACDLVYNKEVNEYSDYIFYYEYNNGDGKESCEITFNNGAKIILVKEAYLN